MNGVDFWYLDFWYLSEQNGVPAGLSVANRVDGLFMHRGRWCDTGFDVLVVFLKPFRRGRTRKVKANNRRRHRSP